TRELWTLGNPIDRPFCECSGSSLHQSSRECDPSGCCCRELQGVRTLACRSQVQQDQPAKQLAWTLRPDSCGDRMSERELCYSPGLYRICDEIIVNAADNWQRDPAGTKDIRIAVDSTTGTVEVWNNGRGVPVAVHPDDPDSRYVPSLLFGRLLTSSNFDDSVKATTGGRNGFGAKLANVFSKEFSVETRSGQTGLEFRQAWRDNMTVAGEPAVQAANGGPDYTRVTFKPDLARFGSTSLDADLVALIQRRAYDLAATCPGVRVYFNGQQVPVRSFRHYCEMYAPPGSLLVSAANQRWLVAACASGGGGGVDSNDELVDANYGFRHVSFVNAIATPAGGRHVELLCDRLLRPLTEAVDASLRNSTALGKRRRRLIDAFPAVKPSQVRRRLWLFCSCRVDNPSFESQAKRRLTLPASKFGAAAAVPEELIKGGSFISVLADVGKRGSVGQAVCSSMLAAAADSASNRSREKSLAEASAAASGAKVAAAAAAAAGKLQHANLVASGVGRGNDCVLVLTEGDSAKALAVAGAAAVPGGRDRIGVLALQGKLINAREAAPTALAESRLLQLLCDVVGLRLGKRYETEADLASLHYRRILIMSDQDTDGIHIRGLVLNLLHCFWPELLLSRWDFLRLLVMPIAKATPPADVKADSEEFYSMDSLAKWISSKPDWRRWSLKYYKGLGGFTAAEGRRFFVRLFSGQSVRLVRRDAGQGGEQDDAALVLAFGPDADARKAWLAEAAADSSLAEELNKSSPNAELSCSDFIHRELVQFSLADNRRSIPALMDGLKPSQRKVLYTCFKRRQRQPIRVPQLAGSVAELTAYRHGDGALFNTIVGMAQNFPGSNNINLLVPGGQFGSRLLGGKDAAAARYIYTCLSPLARLIFHPDDDALLNYRMEDGERVEPVSYSPVVPLAVVNGAEGIGTGWNTSIPNHSLADVMANLRHMLREGGTAEPCLCCRHFAVTPAASLPCPTPTLIRVYFEITELPVRVWSEPYGCSLASLAESVNNYCSDWRVRFLVKLDPSQLARANRMGLYRYFRLSSRYQTVSDIMRDYFDHRLDMYRRRLDYQRAELDALVRLLSNQARFALDVAEGRLNLSGFTGRSDTNRRLSAAGPILSGPPRFENADDFNGGDEFDYLLRMPVWSLTLERRQRLLQDRDEAAGRLRQLAELTPARAWLEDLNALESRAATCTKEEAKQLGGGGDGEDGCETEQQSGPSARPRPGSHQATGGAHAHRCVTALRSPQTRSKNARTRKAAQDPDCSGQGLRQRRRGGSVSFITSAAQQQQQHRLRRIRRPPPQQVGVSSSPSCAAKAAGTPKRTRTHLHGRLFSPAFEDPTPAAVDAAAGNDDNNNSGSRKQQLAAERTTKQRRRGRNPTRLLSRRRCLVHHSVDLASLATAANITAPAPADKELPAPDSGESRTMAAPRRRPEEEEIEATAVGANDGAGDGAAPIEEPTQPPVTDENAMACKNPLASSEHEQLLARKYTDPEEYSYCAGTATKDYLD
uniref:DNA topoisomerase 2 n=1 Tax=Macrostomum lignano TaxID=282301 RepID=A0A1I8IIA3_9PLAT